MSGIRVSIGADYAALAQIGARFRKTAEDIRRGFSERIGHRAFDALMQAGRSLPGILRQSIEAGSRLNDEMAATGASGAGLVVLRRALENAGLAGDRTGYVISRLNRALGGMNEDGEPTNRTIEALGLSMEDLRAADPVDALQSVSAALANIQSPADRATAAMQIFGRSGADMLALFTDAASFDKARQQLGALPETLAAQAQTLDNAQNALRGLRENSLQLGAAMASALTPTIERLTSRLDNLDLSSIGTRLGEVTNAALRLRPAVEALGVAYVATRLQFYGAELKKLILVKGQAATATNILTGAIIRLNAAVRANKFALIVTGVVAGVMSIRRAADDYVSAFEEVERVTKSFDATVENVALPDLAATITDAQSLARALERVSEAEREATRSLEQSQEVAAGNSRAQAAMAETYNATVGQLDRVREGLMNVSSAQMEANAARAAATRAEEEYQRALERSNEQWTETMEAWNRASDAAEKARFDALEDQEKLNALAADEARIREQIADLIGAESAAQGAETIASQIRARRSEGDQRPEDADALRLATEMLEVETQRRAIADQIRAEIDETTDAREAALADARAEAEIARAAANSEWEKVAALRERAELAEEIARLESAGVDAATARADAEALIAARQAESAAQRERENRDRLLDAQAIRDGREAERAIERREEELRREGLDVVAARRQAEAEAAFDQLTQTRARAATSPFDGVSSMAAIAGGGNVGPAMVDYQRQVSDHTRRMVSLLETIAAATPNPAEA